MKLIHVVNNKNSRLFDLKDHHRRLFVMRTEKVLLFL